jgi:hypothetical protein
VKLYYDLINNVENGVKKIKMIKNQISFSFGLNKDYPRGGVYMSGDT